MDERGYSERGRVECKRQRCQRVPQMIVFATWMKVYDEKLRAPPALSEAAVRSQMMPWGHLKSP